MFLLGKYIVDFFSGNVWRTFIMGSWWEPLCIFVGFLGIFLLYVLALRYLAKYMHRRRFIVISTALFGIICLCIPILPSQDVYSYVAYARMGIVYHLNPLTTLPTAIASDPVYRYLYWIDQPSVYGPTWAILSSLLQWLLLRLGFSGIFPMVLVLRAFGLLMHIGSALLVWSICGRLRYSAPGEFISRGRQTLATVAFAWNPLLLFEAGVNGHNDTTMLFFILLTLWFLVRTQPGRPQGIAPTMDEQGKAFLSEYSRGVPSRSPSSVARVPWSLLLAVGMLALATCVKVTAGLLFPGLLLYLWARQRRDMPIEKRWRGWSNWLGSYRNLVLCVLTYLGIIVLLYAPFWQGGAILTVFHVNPTVSRNINSVAEFLSHLYESMRSTHGAPLAAAIGSAAEQFTHTVSADLFVGMYALLCLRALSPSHRIDTVSGLVRWWMLAWLLYCAIGTAWFWPWYTVTFFGLHAILEARSTENERTLGFLHLPLAARLLVFSMLSIYGFYTPAMLYGFVQGLPGFLWTYFRGLWAWAVPLLATRLPLRRSVTEIEMPAAQRSQEEARVLMH